LLPRLSTRDDLRDLMGEVIGELSTSHTYVFGGDSGRRVSRVSTGLLGADLERDGGYYRVSRLYHGDAADNAPSPLLQPGVEVKEGDYILAVNNLPFSDDRPFYASLEARARKEVVLTVNDKPSAEGAREVVVQTLPSERRLRYVDWVRENREYVAEKTDGKVGYIYVRDTSIPGQSDLVRQFVGQHGKEALIIDERWNGGGQLPDRFIELLNRPLSSYFAIREGKEWKVPMVSHQGPKCMLINGNAGSGGDMFPWLFRDAGLGPLIGTRTWGGLVGMIGNPPLIDGGYTSVPRIAFFEPDGTWAVEGHGVDPDIEVIADPSLMVDGGDPQLDKAIEVMLAELEENPFVPVKRPEWPDRSGIGIEESDK
jgi:tricorn protease